MDDLDALRCAKLLLDRHRRDAKLHVAVRADELDAAGDDDGRRAWMRILAACSATIKVRTPVNQDEKVFCRLRRREGEARPKAQATENLA